jgi:hypothetical protein
MLPITACEKATLMPSRWYCLADPLRVCRAFQDRLELFKDRLDRGGGKGL